MFRIDNLANWVKSLFGIKKKDAQAVEAGLQESADRTLDLALHYCPIDTEALRASGVVTQIGSGFDTVMNIRFGNEDVYYAIWVHEDLTKRHEFPTCAKFLERAIREQHGGTAEMISRTMRGTYNRVHNPVTYVEAELS